jgi:hypothetical protein
MSTDISELSLQFFDRLNSISHIKENNTTYFVHMRRALSLSFKSLQASIALFVHAMYPNILEYTGSNLIKECVREFD